MRIVRKRAIRVKFFIFFPTFVHLLPTKTSQCWELKGNRCDKGAGPLRALGDE